MQKRDKFGKPLNYGPYQNGYYVGGAKPAPAQGLGVQADNAAVLELGALVERLEDGKSNDGDRTGGKSHGGGVAEPFDVVICDPPKLAPSVKDLQRATRKYRQLNGGAIRATKPGGLLLSCSCSAAMTQSGGFVKMLHEAAQNEGRTLTILRVSGPAADHVLHPGAPEGAYLTAVLAHVA